HQGFINAVLRAYLRAGCPGMLEIPALEGISEGSEPELGSVDIKNISVNYSTPEWIVKLWLKSYGVSKTLEMLKVNLTEPPLTKRQSLLNPELESVQDEASMEAIKVLSPQPGDEVLDMCAAPGGKSCAMAEIMGNKGSITACDIYENRLKLIENETKRLGIDIIRTEIRDASILPKAECCGNYDVVLCDVPCSGLGVLRRKPEIKYNASEKDVKSLPTLQLRILRNGAYQVKQGGKLMYSTCTVNPAENEEVIKKFMEDGGFTIEKSMQLFPKENGCDGFYYCLMRRTDD
ncbi:MAG: methyltransferase domain-containing protein, partial [Clostridia bacterium]|nr:methyltransferase domain-containing protein [Clostridia bacterium]